MKSINVQSPPVSGIFNVTPPAPVDGQTVPLQTDANGNLLVNIASSIPTVSENLASVGGAAITLGAKTSANSLPVVLATDGAALPVSLPAGQAVELLDSGGVNKASISAAGAVKVDGSAVTQPVSGTITANAGTGNFNENLAQVGGSAVTLGAKTSANSLPVVLATDEAALTVSQATAGNLNAIVQQGVPTVGGLSQSWPIKISDAVNGPAAVKAASTSAVAADPSLVVAVSPNSPATVAQPTAANLNATTIAASTSASVTLNNASAAGSYLSINTAGYGAVVEIGRAHV